MYKLRGGCFVSSLRIILVAEWLWEVVAFVDVQLAPRSWTARSEWPTKSDHAWQSQNTGTWGSTTHTSLSLIRLRPHDSTTVVQDSRRVDWGTNRFNAHKRQTRLAAWQNISEKQLQYQIQRRASPQCTVFRTKVMHTAKTENILPKFLKKAYY